MIDFFYQTLVLVLLSVIVGILILNIGGLGVQHEALFQKIEKGINNTETANLQDRAHSDNLTRTIILNVTGESSNLTKAILGNLTSLIDQHFQLLESKIERNAGIAVRIHSDVQQINDVLLNMTNGTGRIHDILPDFGALK